MTRTITRIGTGLVTAALLATTVAPAFAANNVAVLGNKSGSVNVVSVKNNSASVVNQSSNTNVVNTVFTAQNTGANKVKNNFGGTNSITTGNANSNVVANVSGGGNEATSTSCGCDSNNNVTVAGNGKHSLNAVGITNNNSDVVNQSTNTNVYNTVVTKQNTGDNQVSGNWGWVGGNSVDTGHANANTVLNVSGGGNTSN